MESLQTIQDAALQAIGRNLVNFCRLEACLKALAQMQPSQGNVAELERARARRADQYSKSTLGGAVVGWLGVLDESPEETPYTEDMFDITGSITFGIETTDAERTRHREALKKLLSERNSLVHGELLTVAWRSRDQCQKLIKKLDEQNTRIKGELEILRTVLKGFSKMAESNILESGLERFLDTIESGKGGQLPNNALETDT